MKPLPTTMNLYTAILLLAPAPQDWSAHPLPSLCEPPAQAQAIELLGAGSHIAITPDPTATTAPPEAFLSQSLLTQLIATEFSRSGLTMVPGTNPLLVKASESETTRLRTILSSLDDAGDALEIILDVRLVPYKNEGSGRQPSTESGDDLSSDGTSWTGKLRSGDTISFGERQDLPFVGDFSIEVATDAGVADPQRSSAFHGETIHLTCCRVRGGGAVHIEGVLDIAEIMSVESFDPDTPDLGTFEQPKVAVCQIAFSGVATPTEPVQVLITGGVEGSHSDSIGQKPQQRTLIISARTRPDPKAPSSGWAIRDLAFLNSKGHPLSSPRAGLRAHSTRRDLLPPAHSPTTPASLVGLLSERSSSLADTGRIYSTERLLLIPASDSEALSRADALLSAMEAPLLSVLSCRIDSGFTEIELTATHGRQARVLLGVERPWLIDYETDIAPNSWMPSPVVEVAFDGFCVEGRVNDGSLNARWWVASTEGVLVADSDTAHIGAIQQPERAYSAGHESLSKGSSRVLSGGQRQLELSLR